MSQTEANNLPISQNESEELWDEWNPMMDDFSSSRNTLSLNPDKDPLSIITGKPIASSSRIGQVKICNHYAKYGNCMDGVYCSRLHVEPVAQDKLRWLQETCERNRNRICLNYTYLSPIELEASEKHRLLVTVTNPMKPNNFYLVAPYFSYDLSNHADEDIKFYIDNINTNSLYKIKLEKAHQQLQILFDHHYRVDNVNDDIYRSQIVACRLKDNQFRRAMVLQAPDLAFDEFNYKLLLLDIGTEIECPRECIYDIKAECLSEPPMAINARLDVKPPKNSIEWPPETISFYHDYISQRKHLFCKLIQYLEADRMFRVDIYDIESKESLTELLLRNGLAEKFNF